MIDKGTWTDDEFLALAPNSKLLFVWSWTNERAAICGLYEVSLRRASRETGLELLQVLEALAELALKPFVLYDEETEVLWVVNRAKHANRSPKVKMAMRREVERVPDSDLVDRFVELYGERLGLVLEDA
jgi:hypothetical protein